MIGHHGGVKLATSSPSQPETLLSPTSALRARSDTLPVDDPSAGGRRMRPSGTSRRDLRCGGLHAHPIDPGFHIANAQEVALPYDGESLVMSFLDWREQAPCAWHSTGRWLCAGNGQKRSSQASPGRHKSRRPARTVRKAPRCLRGRPWRPECGQSLSRRCDRQKSKAPHDVELETIGRRDKSGRARLTEP